LNISCKVAGLQRWTWWIAA